MDSKTFSLLNGTLLLERHGLAYGEDCPGLDQAILEATASLADPAWGEVEDPDDGIDDPICDACERAQRELEAMPLTQELRSRFRAWTHALRDLAPELRPGFGTRQFQREYLGEYHEYNDADSPPRQVVLMRGRRAGRTAFQHAVAGGLAGAPRYFVGNWIAEDEDAYVIEWEREQGRRTFRSVAEHSHLGTWLHALCYSGRDVGPEGWREAEEHGLNLRLHAGQQALGDYIARRTQANLDDYLINELPRQQAIEESREYAEQVRAAWVAKGGKPEQIDEYGALCLVRKSAT
jgi:hypothetical protein